MLKFKFFLIIISSFFLKQVKANKEVILCSGTVASPQLLMLSGLLIDFFFTLSQYFTMSMYTMYNLCNS